VSWFNSLNRSVGTSVAGAVIGVVLANTTNSFDSVALASMTGFRISFVIASGASLMAMVTAALLPTRRQQQPTERTASPIMVTEPA
jgi:predicted MFS family arabinose efflux permease